MVNIQKYLDEHYPKDKRDKMWQLNFCQKGLEGFLDLNEFVKIKYLRCTKNQITSLNLQENDQLEHLNCSRNSLCSLNLINLTGLKAFRCSFNKLTNIDFPFNHETFTDLYIIHNPNLELDISIFSDFVNLRWLHVNNTKCYGSIKAFGNLVKLEQLSIHNTNINSDLEYLPSSLKFLYYKEEFDQSLGKFPINKVIGELERKDENFLFLSRWREKNQHLLENFNNKKKQNKIVEQKIESSIKTQKPWTYKDNSVEAQKWLSKWYPQDETCNDNREYWSNISKKLYVNLGKRRNEIEWLDIKNYVLEGFLDLSDFVDLKELNTSNNHLNELNLTGCNSLQFIKCFNNEIIDTNFLWGFNEENLSRIDINCCNIQSTRLDVFSRFINLKELFIGNHVNNNKRAVKKLKKIEKGIYNRFYGSLEPLKNLTKLEYLSIVSTDINSGTEYLPKSLQKIDFSYVERPESRVKEIQKELTAFVYEIELEHVKSKLSGYNLFPYSRFSDHKFIAKGGFSKIYKVKFSLGNSNKDCYILKSLPLSLEDEKLFNEFANHRSLKYTIHCYGITQDLEGIRYLILDYCEHGNLRKFVKDNNLSSNDRFKILFSLAVSLNRIHSKGFLHKDFHPGNILVSSDEKGGHRTIISDLGTSVLLHNDKEGKIYGVLPYVAPEVLRKEPYIKASDIYSFGMIMYEILTGIFPFGNRNWDAKSFITQIVNNNSRPCLENVNLPNELKELIRGCWKEKTEERPTASKAIEIIKRAQESIDFSKYEFQPLLETKQLHSSVSYYSKLINSDGVFNPTGLNNCQFDNLSLEDGGDSEEYFLIHKNLEKEIQNIKESLDSEITELVDKFIEIKKQSLKNREDKQIKKQVGEQKKQLKEKGLLEEKINKIIRYCEKLVGLEQNEQFQVYVEIPTNK